MFQTMSGSNTDGHPKAEPGEISNPSRRSRVVILEDDQFLAQFYEMLIKKVSPHSQILFFTDGDTAWGELTKAEPDLFITDVEHPGTDAWEMFRMLAAAKVTYPILMISGDFVPGDKHKHLYPSLNLTAMSKPFDVSVFIKILADLLKASDGFLGSTEQTRPNDLISGAASLA